MDALIVFLWQCLQVSLLSVAIVAVWAFIAGAVDELMRKRAR